MFLGRLWFVLNFALGSWADCGLFLILCWVLGQTTVCPYGGGVFDLLEFVFGEGYGIKAVEEEGLR